MATFNVLGAIGGPSFSAITRAATNARSPNSAGGANLGADMVEVWEPRTGTDDEVDSDETSPTYAGIIAFRPGKTSAKDGCLDMLEAVTAGRDWAGAVDVDPEVEVAAVEAPPPV